MEKISIAYRANLSINQCSRYSSQAWLACVYLVVNLNPDNYKVLVQHYYPT